MDISYGMWKIEDIDVEKFEILQVGIEIQCFPQHKLDVGLDELLHEVKEKLCNFKGNISLHGSSFDLNPGSTDSKVIELTKYRYKQSIDIASEIGAKHVIFHSQVNPLVGDRISKLKRYNSIKFWRKMIPYLEEKNIVVVLENEYDTNYDDVIHIINEVNSSYLKACLDVGHALTYSKLSLEEWIKGLGKQLVYMHLHWNNGERDEHKKPRDEELRYLKELLDKYNVSPIISTEYGIDNLEEEAIRLKKNIGE